MQKAKIQILSTRPLSKPIINEAAMHNIIIDEISFIETRSLEDKAIGDIIRNYLQKEITVIFTSMNAVEAVVKHLNDQPAWKIYCIGNTTKNLVTDHFKKESISRTAANAEDLAGIIIDDNIDYAVFFCGNKRRDELPAKLKQNGINVDEIVVYNTNETPVLINKKYDSILFFSPSAVKSFFSINKVNDKTHLFAIGSTTAQAIQQYYKKNVLISGSPGKENLVRQVIEHYKGGM